MSASGSPEPIAGPAVGRPRAKSLYYPHSVIRNLDISNVNGVRDVMRVISRYNSLPYFEVVREDPLENSGLPAQQHAVAKRIIMAIHATIRTHPLLFRAVGRNGKGGIATKSPTKASPPKNGVGKKRGPVSMFKSCENCKKTHYKCDKAQPTCGRCAARGWECRSQAFSGASKAVFKEE
ncbi:hypothetical protein HYFRA_00003109 [Hymenoscyphus fraxineus]|uniref:Zn(2)-C6 fungal-type domain-containing protein n=1 Tax=Hymenoscyphus fraxineus TaxID=746836 RepID=A0A9N9KSQ6_9HELO|nr:hypothetical protein HYFRA_00003109 [Hymenoscyphus fraxineus]